LRGARDDNYMTQSDEGSRDEIHQAMLRYLDGTLPAQEIERLSAMVKENPAMGRVFATLLLQQMHLAEIGQEEKGLDFVLSPEAVMDSKNDSVAVNQPRPRRVLWAAAAGLALLGGVAGLWLLQADAGPVITRVAGAKVRVERAGKILTAKEGLGIRTGDTIDTGSMGELTIRYGGERTQLQLRHNVLLTIARLVHGKRFELNRGNVEAIVAPQPEKEPMVWVTPQAEATVLGTALSLEVDETGTRLEVTEGKVRFSNTLLQSSVVVPAGHEAFAGPGRELSATPVDLNAPGGVWAEYWWGITGTEVTNLTSSLKFSAVPDSRHRLIRFEAPADLGENYGSRIRGYLHPPVTGDYLFWIASDDASELWLSRDDNPLNKKKLCFVSQWTHVREWGNEPTQKSVPIRLVGGGKYYIEALHKQGIGSDHFEAAWQPAGRPLEIIPGAYLSPFVEK